MKYACRSACLFLFLLSLAALSFAGDIQVSCEPGLRVYLDDEFMGVSSAKEDGLFLLDIDNGTHTLRVEKDGHLSQVFQVNAPDLPIEVKVGEFDPVPLTKEEPAPVVEEVTQQVGSLIVTSAPQNCVVEINGEPQVKESPHLSIGGLAAGEHTISFSKEGYERISDIITIKPGVEVTVRGNLKTGKVETMHGGEGSLRVISDPVGITVRFLGKRSKTHMRWNLSHVPAGEHPIEFTWHGRKLSTSVTIMDNQRTLLNVSFMKGAEPFRFSYEPEKKEQPKRRKKR